MKFKKIEWFGNDPKGIMQSYTIIYNNFKIGFRIMNSVSGLCLIDFNKEQPEFISVKTVEEAKEIAQEKYENICNEIIKNMI